MTASALAQDLVNQLLLIGAHDVVVSPGSRSGPVARAMAAADAQGLLRLHVRVDEREAAFLALGLAKSSHQPTPVITTSGTAVANLHPALLEALHATVPLLAITADRPARLRGTGANQTTVQPGIFPGISTVDDIADLGGHGPRPEHLNLELDEPLTEPFTWTFQVPDMATSLFIEFDSYPPVELSPGPRTVVVAGDARRSDALSVAHDGNWPLLAEPSSSARLGDALTSYRLLLANRDLSDRIERVVSFGHPTLSRAVTSLLARDIEIVHVGDQSTFPVPAGPRVSFTSRVEVTGADDGAWLAEWQAADRAMSQRIDRLIETDPDAEPLRVARAVWQAVTEGGLLVVGSSNPIRDLDLVAQPLPLEGARDVLANRGLAGIDGVLSTAIGAALAAPGPALAYVGDLTFLHGSNGLLIGPQEPRPDLTIVVVNDDGGGIFAGLEQGAPEYADSFERVFATPTAANLAQLCAAFAVPHRRVSVDEVSGVLAEGATGIRVIEVPIRRDGRRRLLERLTSPT